MPEENTKAEQQRRPRFRRVDPSELPMRLQDQDRELLRWVYNCRFMTSRQLQAIDPRSDRIVLRRLQRLFHHRFVSRIPLTARRNDVFIYALAGQGAEELRTYGVDVPSVDWDKKNSELKDRYFVEHELLTTDARVAVELYLRDHPDIELASESPGDELFYINEDKEEKRIIPDWPFTLIDQDDALDFFEESDRSTMTDGDYLKKLRAYFLFWKQEHAKAEQGDEEALYRFKVLTVCLTDARMQNLRAVAKYADDRQTGSNLFYFTSRQRFSIDEPARLFDNIWETPADDRPHHILE